MLAGLLRYTIASLSSASRKMYNVPQCHSVNTCMRRSASVQANSAIQPKLSSIRNSNMRRSLRKPSPPQRATPMQREPQRHPDRVSADTSTSEARRVEDGTSADSSRSVPGCHPIVRHPGMPSTTQPISPPHPQNSRIRSWKNFGNKDDGLAVPARELGKPPGTPEAPVTPAHKDSTKDTSESPPEVSAIHTPDGASVSQSAADRQIKKGSSGKVYLPDVAALKARILQWYF